LRKNSAQANSIFRIIDANVNRTKEGLRVCEEVARFILDSRSLTRQFKRIRHALDRLQAVLPAKEALLAARAAKSDVGRPSSRSELRRRDAADILYANIQRVKESLRVLEEFTKLSDRKASAGFKEIRYDIYEIEKSFARKIASLSHHRSANLLS
jgi:thiamine-phosphate pyrophosphorylase